MEYKTLAEINFEKTRWLHDKVWGIGFDIFSKMKIDVEEKGMTPDESVKSFDTLAFAKKVNDLGAGYCIVTLNQTTKYLGIPNSAYEKYSGYKRGEASTNIDFVEELLSAFAPYGIELILSFSCDGPSKDKQAREGFGTITYGLPPEESQMTVEFMKKWCEVIKEASLRYGKRIKAWWFDGTFYNNGYNEERVAMIAEAARSGNKDAIVACNIYGLMPHPLEREEYMREGAPSDNYTFGEMWNYSVLPENAMVGHCRWHIWSWYSSPMSLLDENGNKIEYTKEYLRNYITEVHKRGGVVTLNGFPDELMGDLKYIGKSN